jgi:Lsr2
MTQKTTAALEDDLDGGPTDETMRLGIGGTMRSTWAKNVTAFRRKLAPFIDHAGRAGRGQRRRPGRIAASRGAGRYPGARTDRGIVLAHDRVAQVDPEADDSRRTRSPAVPSGRGLRRRLGRPPRGRPPIRRRLPPPRPACSQLRHRTVSPTATCGGRVCVHTFRTVTARRYRPRLASKMPSGITCIVADHTPKGLDG